MLGRMPPLLTATQERAALLQIAKLRGAARQRARNRFAAANIRLVVSVAKRFSRSVPLEDRVQDGCVGLLKAIDRFDPSRNVRFSTYAVWWIRHEIMRSIVNTSRVVRIPAHLHTTWTKARRARERMRAEMKREPTMDEIANVIGRTVDQIKRADAAMELRTVEPPADTSSFAPGMDDAIDRQRIGKRVQNLRPIERQILCDRMDGRTLREIGADYGLCRERIRQIQQRAIDRLQS